MDPTARLPEHLVEHAREFADGTRTPVDPKDASTVVLLRDGDGQEGGLEVYLLRRTRGMAFAGGFCVFPGGGVDPRDFEQEIGWVGPSAEQWAELLRTTPEHARALVCAAVRETFEESGVLLAGPTEDTVVDDTTGDDWESDRQRLEARELAFTDFLRRRGLKLRTDLLQWWGTWVTPVFEPKRYDTRFFVAELPRGQVTRDVSTESDHVVWLSVRDAIDAVDAGSMAMLPPTYATCLELYDHTRAADALAAAATKDRTPILPEMQVDDDGGYLDLPHRLVALGESVARAAVRLMTGWQGGSFGAHAHCVLAPNPGIMTLDGTNTWVLRASSEGRAIVVDPGPLEDAHLDAVAALAGDVAGVLLTHGHPDHSEGARAFAERVGCGVRALDPAFRLGDEGLRDGDVVSVDDLEVRVVATPGHTSDSLSFLVPVDRAVLTGDTVLGRGTTVVAHPDGKLGAYLGSLDRLHALAEAREVRTVWPGHGPVLDDALAVLDFYRAHRRDRLEQVREALGVLGDEATPREVVEHVYVDVDPVLWGAAELSVRAQLDYLRP